MSIDDIKDLSAKERLTAYLNTRGLLGTSEVVESFDLKNAPLKTPPVVLHKSLPRIMNVFIDRTATVPESSVVWHFSVVLANAKIGENCSVGSNAEIGRGSVIGDRSRISSGVFLPSNSRVGPDVFIGPHVVFTDDKHPRTLKPGETYTAEPPIVEDGASIGARAVILPGIRIGRGAFVAAGAIVTKDVPAGGTVRSEPARPFTLSPEAQSRLTLSVGGGEKVA